MKRLISGILALMLIVGLSGCEDEESPVDILTQTRIVNNLFLGKNKMLTVKTTSKVDAITINDIIVNKGNCKMIKLAKVFPKKLKFGESVEVGFPANCNALQVEVVTNNGNWTVEY